MDNKHLNQFHYNYNIYLVTLIIKFPQKEHIWTGAVL